MGVGVHWDGAGSRGMSMGITNRPRERPFTVSNTDCVCLFVFLFSSTVLSNLLVV